ncbi:MAG: class I SAM-dependent methyltransferase [Chitinophagales bacterium]
MNAIIKKFFGQFPPVKRLLKYRTLWEPGHYYSAIPDPSTALAVTEKSLSGSSVYREIDLRDKSQLGLLKDLVPFMVQSTFRNEEKVPGHRFFNKNGIYGYSDSLILEAMIRHLKPKRIIEAGSGFTSALMMDTNQKFFDFGIQLMFIEPYPQRLFNLLSETDKERVSIKVQRLQSVDLSDFKMLRENDILFVDSTHVAKTGSDLLYLFFEILPALQSGVYIHFHDIFDNFEYQPWHFKEYSGFAWNEAYFLRSFLMYNTKFEIVLYSSYLESRYKEEIRNMMPDYPFSTGAQFWMKKL